MSEASDGKLQPRYTWEQKRDNLILNNNWKAGPGSSGKILNPGKPYFMNLAVNWVRSEMAKSPDCQIIS